MKLNPLQSKQFQHQKYGYRYSSKFQEAKLLKAGILEYRIAHIFVLDTPGPHVKRSGNSKNKKGPTGLGTKIIFSW